MSKPIALVAAVLVAPWLSCLPSAAAPATTQSVRTDWVGRIAVSAAPQSARVTAGDPVYLRMTVENVADEPVMILLDKRGEDFQFSAVGPDGKIPSRTAYTTKWAPEVRIISGKYPIEMTPGERLIYLVQANLYFDFTSPGVYSIAGQYLFDEWGRGGEAKIATNAVKVEVIPPTIRHDRVSPTTQPSTQPLTRP